MCSFLCVLLSAAINDESSLPLVCSVSVWNWILHQWTGTSLWSACCAFLCQGGFWKNGNFFHLKCNGKCRFICSISPQIMLSWKNSDPALAELPDLWNKGREITLQTYCIYLSEALLLSCLCSLCQAKGSLFFFLIFLRFFHLSWYFSRKEWRVSSCWKAKELSWHRALTEMTAMKLICSISRGPCGQGELPRGQSTISCGPDILVYFPVA